MNAAPYLGRSCVPRSRGFTLLEVLLSVTIFLLLAGGIFTAVSVTTQASTEVALARLDAERLDALQRFLRHLFSNLPATSRLELRVRQAAPKGRVVELLISPAPDFAHFSQTSDANPALALGAIPDGAGALAFSLTNYDADLSTTDRDDQLQGPDWISLLPGVTSIRWRFARSEETGLQETWEPDNGRPGLADLEITLADGTGKHWQFFIPELTLPTGNPTTPE